MKQRDKMKELAARYKGDENLVVSAYAEAERKGEVNRKSNSHNWNSVVYAKALMRDGKRKNWLNS